MVRWFMIGGSLSMVKPSIWRFQSASQRSEAFDLFQTILAARRYGDDDDDDDQEEEEEKDEDEDHWP